MMGYLFLRKFPFSAKCLFEWLNDKSHKNGVPNFDLLPKKAIMLEVGKVDSVILVPITDRYLYDFFDYQPLYVVLEQFDDGDFFAKITAYEIYNNAAFAIEGHIEELYNGSDLCQAIFDNRKDAEKDGFEMAFRILETRLNPSFVFVP